MRIVPAAPGEAIVECPYSEDAFARLIKTLPVCAWSTYNIVRDRWEPVVRSADIPTVEALYAAYQLPRP